MKAFPKIKMAVDNIIDPLTKSKSWPFAIAVAGLAALAGIGGFGIAFLTRSARKALKRAEEDQLDIIEPRRLERERMESLRVTRLLATIVESCDEAILSKD